MMKKISLYTITFACFALCILYLYGRGDMANSTTTGATASRATSSKASTDKSAGLTTVASSFNAPTGIAFDSSGAMYVTNWSGNSITRITANGERKTIYSNISSPAGIVIDAQDNIYVSSYSDDYILKITADGKAEKISDGYHTPTGIAFSNSGKLLITNRSTGEIVALDLNNGRKEIIARGLSTPVGVTQLPDESLVVSQYSGRLTLVRPDGRQEELGSGFNRPGVGIVTVSPNVVAVIDNGADMVRTVDIKTRRVSNLVTSLPGAVALTLHNNRYYIGTWGDGTVYAYSPK